MSSANLISCEENVDLELFEMMATSGNATFSPMRTVKTAQASDGVFTIGYINSRQ